MNKRKPVFDDCSTLERFTGVDYFDDKSLLVYAASTYDEESGRKIASIVLKNIKDETSEVISSGHGEGSPAFSPDGSRLLYLSAEAGMGRQIFVMDLATREKHQVTEMHCGAMEPIWSPDGSKILFASPGNGTEDPASMQGAIKANAAGSDDEAGEAEKAADAGNAVKADNAAEVHRPDEALVIEDFGYKFDGLGFIRPEGHMHLWVASADGGSAVRISEGEFDYMHHNWCQDSQHVICESNRFRSKKESIGFDLLKIGMDGETVKLTEGLWLVSYPNPMRPVCTPDGKYAVFGCLDERVMNKVTEFDDSVTYPEVYLYKAALDGSGAEKIFTGSDECIQCVQFAYNAGCGWGLDKLQITNDGKTVVFLSGYKGQGNVYCVSLDGGTGQTLLSGKQVYNGLSKIRNGRFLAAKSETDMPESYYIYDMTAGTLSGPVAVSAEKYMNETEVVRPEDFTVKSLDGETEIHGWVYPPAGYEPGKKYPAILYVHGGPHPFYTYGFTPEHQALAAEGFCVLCCNPRGTSSYGWEHQQISKSTDGTAFYDCLQFVDEAVKRCDFIDGDRVGVTGGSYGGYMVNYMAGHCDRFKAYVSQRSISNDLISYASSDMQGSSMGYRSFEDFMVDKLKTSPIACAQNIKRPFLILHGMDDYRTPVEGAHQLFVAIKDLHPELPVRMVLYPHTSHEQPTDPVQLKDYYDEMTGWFRKYL